MKRRKIFRYFLITTSIMGIGWIALTLYVEAEGPAKEWTFGGRKNKNVLIVYDADPFYNLDEQVCLALAKSIASDSTGVVVATVASAKKLDPKIYDLFVYCANTYNWRPDWGITDYIEEHSASVATKPVVAITLGAGSTESSRKKFEYLIKRSGGELISSHSLWLWRPNDESKLEQPNVSVAVAMAHMWGKQIAEKIKH